MQRRPLLLSATLAPWAGVARASGRWQAALARAAAMRDLARAHGDQAYGAVVADAQGRVVAEAPSRVVRLKDPDAHAERQALAAAQQALQRQDLGGLVLVGSARACPACQRAAARAGVAALVWPGGESEPALTEAADRGDLPSLAQLLDDGAPLDTTDLRRRTPLLVAVQRGHDAAAQLLVRRGADINAQDEIDDSPFLLAGARGRTAMLRDMLLQTGTPVVLLQPELLVGAAVAAVAGFFFAGLISRAHELLVALEALAIGFLATVGATSALALSLSWPSVVFMGTITATGGLVLRDVLAGDAPMILRPGAFIGVAAVAGTSVFVLLVETTDIDAGLAQLAAIVVVFALRMLSRRLGWETRPAIDMTDRVWRFWHRAQP